MAPTQLSAGGTGTSQVRLCCSVLIPTSLSALLAEQLHFQTYSEAHSWHTAGPRPWWLVGNPPELAMKGQYNAYQDGRGKWPYFRGTYWPRQETFMHTARHQAFQHLQAFSIPARAAHSLPVTELLPLLLLLVLLLQGWTPAASWH